MLIEGIKGLFYNGRDYYDKLKVVKEKEMILQENQHLYDKIIESLDEEHKILFQKYIGIYEEIYFADAHTFFLDGFKLGLGTGLECSGDGLEDETD